MYVEHPAVAFFSEFQLFAGALLIHPACSGSAMEVVLFYQDYATIFECT